MAAPRSPLVLITRPEESARTLQQELEARGYATLIEPMLSIEHLGPMAPLPDHVQAIVLTSAHAVPALSDAAKSLPVFAVGRTTGEAARAAGCAQVISGDGDGAALARLIAGRCRPEDGAILHIAGETVRDDLHRILTDQGFDLRRDVVYRACCLRRVFDGCSPGLAGARDRGGAAVFPENGGESRPTSDGTRARASC